jgi:hypothetical protein
MYKVYVYLLSLSFDPHAFFGATPFKLARYQKSKYYNEPTLAIYRNATLESFHHFPGLHD